jgi:hypothetical protein
MVYVARKIIVIVFTPGAGRDGKQRDGVPLSLPFEAKARHCNLPCVLSCHKMSETCICYRRPIFR